MELTSKGERDIKDYLKSLIDNIRKKGAINYENEIITQENIEYLAAIIDLPLSEKDAEKLFERLKNNTFKSNETIPFINEIISMIKQFIKMI